MTPPVAGRRIQAFLDDLSNWYVRRARRRFWNPGGAVDGDDARAAFRTLHPCLVTVAQLLAPFTPFIAEELWRNLAADRDGAPTPFTCPTTPWPVPTRSIPALDDAMAAARQIVELGRRVRVETKSADAAAALGSRRPLPRRPRALVPVLPLIADELNVKQVVLAESDASFGRWRAKPNYKVLGPKLGARVKDVAAALADDDGGLAARLARGDTVTLDAGDGPSVAIDPDDVDLAQEVSEGWGVASDGGLTVALDLELTADLRREGQARELVRAIQDARKAAGLDVRIGSSLACRPRAMWRRRSTRSRDYIAGETLAVNASGRAARRRRVPARGGDRRSDGGYQPAEGFNPDSA